MATKFLFLPEEDDMLIENIKNYAVLFDRKHKEYKNYSLKEIIWGEISSKLNRTPTDCKKRWRNIRDTYIKSKRRPRSKWPLLQYLNFLDNVALEDNFQGNMDELQFNSLDNIPLKGSVNLGKRPLPYANNDTLETSHREASIDSSDTSQSYDIEQSTYPQKRLRQSLNETNQLAALFEKKDDDRVEESDPIFSFFKSMALTVKTFEPDLVVEAKSQIFNIVHQLEVESLKRRSNNPADAIIPDDVKYNFTA